MNSEKLAGVKAARPGLAARLGGLLPGVSLSILITLVSIGIQSLEQRAFGHPYLEALVIAIVLGMVVRTAWVPSSIWRSGIAFSAKQVLEVAVTLLGASISMSTLAASGFALLGATVATVAVVLPASYVISRLLGLGVRLSILVACGNSVCGNSAIAAVAPVIGADGDEIASSISFTAILGVLIVLGLPLLIPLLGLSAAQYGVLAGLTVYAVPQVLAATVPAGLVATQIGTLVKLVRVLTLGPIVVGFSLFGRNLRNRAEHPPASDRLSYFQVRAVVYHRLSAIGRLALLRTAAGRLGHALAEDRVPADDHFDGGFGIGRRCPRPSEGSGAGSRRAVTLSLLLLMAFSFFVAHSLAK